MILGLEIKNGFATIQKLYVYFTSSGKRWKIVTDILTARGIFFSLHNYHPIIINFNIKVLNFFVKEDSRIL